MATMTLSGDRLAFPNVNNTSSVTFVERPKRWHRKLPTGYIVAMTCGVGGYVIYRRAVTQQLILVQTTNSVVNNILPWLVVLIFSRHNYNSNVPHLGLRANLWLDSTARRGSHE